MSIQESANSLLEEINLYNNLFVIFLIAGIVFLIAAIFFAYFFHIFHEIKILTGIGSKKEIDRLKNRAIYKYSDKMPDFDAIRPVFEWSDKDRDESENKTSQKLVYDEEDNVNEKTVLLEDNTVLLKEDDSFRIEKDIMNIYGRE